MQYRCNGKDDIPVAAAQIYPFQRENALGCEHFPGGAAVNFGVGADNSTGNVFLRGLSVFPR